MRIKFRGAAIVVLACGLIAAAPPARAADPAPPPDLKADIDGFLHRIDGATRGLIKWDGAEKIDIHKDGDASVADIVHGRIVLSRPTPPPGAPPGGPAKPPGEELARIVFDHIVVRRAPAADGALDLSITGPKDVTIHIGPDQDATLALTDAVVHATLDGQSERARDVSSSFAGARVDDKTSGGWIKFGPAASSYKLVAAADGSWTTPSKSEIKNIEFFFPAGPVGGTIDRISGEGHAAGPDLAAANKLRDQLNAMNQDNLAPAARSRAFLALLPDFLSTYSQSEGTFGIEGLTVRKPSAEPLVSLAKASIDLAMNGMSGDTASLRISLKDDGAKVAASLPHADRIPRRAVIDFGLENVGTASLRAIIAAALKSSEAATPQERQAAGQQMLAAAAQLTPTFRVYDLAADVGDAGVDANAEAKGSPLSPKGYAADADVTVRNLDALQALFAGTPFATYLPLLKEIGASGTPPAAGGAPQTKFHVASAPGKWITVNGDDVSGWFAPRPPGAGEPRVLKPAVPPLSGDDVRAVQRKLAAAKIDVPQNGVYDGDTAAAVARYQKANGLNVSGVLDGPTRLKLGVAN